MDSLPMSAQSTIARMRTALLAFAVAFPVLAQSPPPAPPPTDTQKSSVSAGLLSVPLTVREQYLGRSGAKTVVKFVLEVSKADLRNAIGATPRVFSFFITGEVKKADGTGVEGFRVPVDVDLSSVDLSKPLEATFLRALPPGSLVIKLGLEGVTGKALGGKDVSLTVPAMESDFSAEDAGKDASGLPSAAAVILESENREVAPPSAAGYLKILAPTKEGPVGLIRVECEVRPPVTRVEFYLEEKKLLVRNRPPYSVELDLG